MDNIMFNRLRAQIRTVSGGGGLPSGYTQLNYLQSTGAQYIDTGFVPTDTSGFNVSIAIASPSTDRLYLGGASTNQTVATKWWLGSYSFGYYGGFNAQYNTGVLVTAWSIHSLGLNLYNSRQLTFDDIVKNSALKTLSYPNQVTAYLFRANAPAYAHGGTAWAGSSRIYSVQFTEGALLVRDFVPALRNSDSKAGMYDKVNDVFYTNAGTGEFTYA